MDSLNYPISNLILKNRMHKSSYELMELFVLNYSDKLNGSEIQVLDFGSRNVNGTYKNLFSDERYNYTGVDIEPGDNVDIVIDDSYNWSILNSNAFDVIISGQALEHTEFFWLIFEEFKRLLKPGGLLCCIAPSSGYEHRHPVDCWRFFPDGFRALCKYVNLQVLDTYVLKETFHDDGSKEWKDTILIAQKDDSSLS